METSGPPWFKFRAPTITLKDLQSGPDGVDWLGGRWLDISLWTPKSFFSRAERCIILR
jgi:hypothetical protein